MQAGNDLRQQHLGLSVTDMAVATKRGDKVLGMHFHNPAPVMQLLELVRTIMTSRETIDTVKQWGATSGKRWWSPDVGGFIVTRLFTPFLLGAVRMLEGALQPGMRSTCHETGGQPPDGTA